MDSLNARILSICESLEQKLADADREPAHHVQLSSVVQESFTQLAQTITGCFNELDGDRIRVAEGSNAKCRELFIRLKQHEVINPESLQKTENELWIASLTTETYNRTWKNNGGIDWRRDPDDPLKLYIICCGDSGPMETPVSYNPSEGFFEYEGKRFDSKEAIKGFFIEHNIFYQAQDTKHPQMSRFIAAVRVGNKKKRLGTPFDEHHPKPLFKSPENHFDKNPLQAEILLKASIAYKSWKVLGYFLDSETGFHDEKVLFGAIERLSMNEKRTLLQPETGFLKKDKVELTLKAIAHSCTLEEYKELCGIIKSNKECDEAMFDIKSNQLATILWGTFEDIKALENSLSVIKEICDPGIFQRLKDPAILINELVKYGFENTKDRNSFVAELMNIFETKADPKSLAQVYHALFQAGVSFNEIDLPYSLTAKDVMAINGLGDTEFSFVMLEATLKHRSYELSPSRKLQCIGLTSFNDDPATIQRFKQVFQKAMGPSEIDLFSEACIRNNPQLLKILDSIGNEHTPGLFSWIDFASEAKSSGSNRDLMMSRTFLWLITSGKSGEEIRQVIDEVQENCKSQYGRNLQQQSGRKGTPEEFKELIVKEVLDFRREMMVKISLAGCPELIDAAFKGEAKKEALRLAAENNDPVSIMYLIENGVTLADCPMALDQAANGYAISCLNALWKGSEGTWVDRLSKQTQLSRDIQGIKSERDPARQEELLMTLAWNCHLQSEITDTLAFLDVLGLENIEAVERVKRDLLTKGAVFTRLPQSSLQKHVFQEYARGKQYTPQAFMEHQLQWASKRRGAYLEAKSAIDKGEIQTLAQSIRSLGRDREQDRNAVRFGPHASPCQLQTNRFMASYETVRAQQEKKAPGTHSFTAGTFILRSGSEVTLSQTTQFDNEYPGAQHLPSRSVEFVWSYPSIQDSEQIMWEMEDRFQELLAMNLVNSEDQRKLILGVAELYSLGCHALLTDRGNSQYFLEIHNMILEKHGILAVPTQKYPYPDTVALMSGVEEFRDEFYPDCFVFFDVQTGKQIHP